ncbi:antibiotic biosynthesis monooxygenase family protein [Limoniibacter endophyticus]|uniref:Antibiotic biosynthesis monooxygenase n=1 Tax=Limoniibacter endophyticus TaxID=1565040 RepID=A0A8J3GFJ4_9HYPH|nr:antibiotic biosynthesis monooxygenase [Limoniibacter endophyticus]GHC63092.1 antibiotic biosynthesis monooxygenase [Limoniibacter endophyticus]
MIAVIFEVLPAEGNRQVYLSIAATLREELETIEGFISVERFQSLTNPDKMLSLSFFETEEAVQRWRSTRLHRTAQAKGRGGVFRDYRLRVAQVIRDYGMGERDEAPADSKDAHDMGA